MERARSRQRGTERERERERYMRKEKRKESEKKVSSSHLRSDENRASAQTHERRKQAVNSCTEGVNKFRSYRDKQKDFFREPLKQTFHASARIIRKDTARRQREREGGGKEEEEKINGGGRKKERYVCTCAAS